MVSTYNYARSLVLQDKTRLIELDTQLNKLDATSAWKCLALGLYTPDNNEGGSGGVIGEPTTSLDRSSVSMTPIQDIEVPICKSSPLLVKQPKNTNVEDFQGGCAITEENPAL